MKFYIGSGFKNVDIVKKVSEELKKQGWIRTCSWEDIEVGTETREDLIRYSKLEMDAIEKSDIVIIILPAGRGTHVELGYSLAKGKRIILYASDQEEFSLENTVNFYEVPQIEKFVGSDDELVRKLVK